MTPASIGMGHAPQADITGYANAMVQARVTAGATPAQIREIARDLLAHADRTEKGEKK